MRIELVCPAAEDSAHLRSLASPPSPLSHPTTSSCRSGTTLSTVDPTTELDGNADLAANHRLDQDGAPCHELAAAYRQHGVKIVMAGSTPPRFPTKRSSTATPS